MKKILNETFYKGNGTYSDLYVTIYEDYTVSIGATGHYTVYHPSGYIQIKDTKDLYHGN